MTTTGCYPKKLPYLQQARKYNEPHPNKKLPLVYDI